MLAIFFYVSCIGFSNDSLNETWKRSYILNVLPGNYYSYNFYCTTVPCISRRGQQRSCRRFILFANLTKRTRRAAVPVSSGADRVRSHDGDNDADAEDVDEKATWSRVPRRGLETVGQVGRSRNALRRPTSAQAGVT